MMPDRNDVYLLGFIKIYNRERKTFQTFRPLAGLEQSSLTIQPVSFTRSNLLKSIIELSTPGG